MRPDVVPGRGPRHVMKLMVVGHVQLVVEVVGAAATAGAEAAAAAGIVAKSLIRFLR